jgi:tetratricopeptide (TPR) repeat protein
MERHRHIAHRFGTDHGVAAHMMAGWAFMVLGSADSALRELEEAVALATVLDQPFDQAYAYLFKSTIHWARGESQEVIDAAASARRLADEQGFDFWTALSCVFETSELIVRTGNADLLPTLIEASLVAGESGNRGGSAPVLVRVAEALRAAKDPAGALAMIDAGFAMAAETGQRWWDGELMRVRAELLVEGASEPLPPDVATEAEDLLRNAIELAQQRGYLFHEVLAASSLVRIQRGRSGMPDALRLLRDAADRCTEGRETPILLTARGLLDEFDESVQSPRPA